jgi:autotransporter-associated beta strand protein/T5SS/PEP-CTERM-associated repeat protein
VIPRRLLLDRPSGVEEEKPVRRPTFLQTYLRRLAAPALASFLVTGASAQSTWIGGVGSLYVATNWSGGTVPQSFDSIIITNGGTVQSDNTADVANTSIGGGSTYAVLPGILSYFTPDNVYLGTFGSGTLTVGSQAEMAAAADLYVGYASNATGVVTADGGYLSPFTTYIGYDGSGTMTLENGSTLQSTFGYVGYSAGSTGLVQMDSSTWKAESGGAPLDITVGRQGNGEVRATNSILSAQNFVLGDSAGATGTVSANGGTITVANETQVGNGGTGNLNLSNSATMNTYGLTVGVLSNSTGRLSVADSSLTSSQSILLGLSGAGTLTTDGASIKAPQIFIARNSGSTGTALVSGGLTELTGELHVGAEGNGTFTLQGAGTLTTDKGNMGFAAGSKGTANILNGTWSNKQAIFVGVSGEGTLNIGTQGSIHSESGFISQNASGAGAVNITGGSWTMTNTLAVGVRGTGSLSASNGARISSEWAQLGLTNGSKTGVGRLRLDEANGYSGGTLVEQGVLEFSAGSAFGTGGLTISTAELRAITNATLSTSPTFITVSNGQTATFSATAGNTLTLATSDFTVQDGAALTFGSAGNTGTVVFAPVNVTASSNIPSVSVQVGTLAAGNARLAELTAQASTTTVASGATLEFQDNLSTGGINALFGAGTVNTGTNSATTLTVNSGNFSGSIAGWGDLVKESAGTLTLSGQNAFAGTTTVNGGTLVVDGSLGFGLGNATVNNGGTIGGTGLVGVITLSGGTVSPGSSPGTLNAESLFWEEGTLRFELGPTPATSDRLVLSSQLVGLALPSGPYTFDFVDNGWTTNTYDLITFGSTSITNLSEFNYSNGGGFAGNFAYNGNTLQFTVTTVPEPGTWSLLACAALAFLLLRARRGGRKERTSR